MQFAAEITSTAAWREERPFTAPHSHVELIQQKLPGEGRGLGLFSYPQAQADLGQGTPILMGDRSHWDSA